MPGGSLLLEISVSASSSCLEVVVLRTKDQLLVLITYLFSICLSYKPYNNLYISICFDSFKRHKQTQERGGPTSAWYPSKQCFEADMPPSSFKDASSNQSDGLYIYDTKSPDQIHAAPTKRRQRAKAAKALAQRTQAEGPSNSLSSTTQTVVCGIHISPNRPWGKSKRHSD